MGRPIEPNSFDPNNSLLGVVSSVEALNALTPLDTQPTSQNYIYPTHFKFIINRLPKMEYMVTKATLPSFGYDSTFDQDTPFVKVKHTANRVAFANLEISFLVDEDMSNWIEIYNWIKSTALVDDFDDIDPQIKDHYSDATLVITNSAMNANVEVRFKNIFPISITGLEFDSTITDLTAMQCDTTFAYDYYTVTKL